MKQLLSIPILVLLSISLFAQPIPDCQRGDKRIFIKSNESLQSDLVYYGATPSQIDENIKCFRLDNRIVTKINKGVSLSFTLYPADAYKYWMDTARMKEVAMVIEIRTKEFPDTFNYYLELPPYKKGRYCIDLSDAVYKAITDECKGCKEKSANNITPTIWRQCLVNRPSIKKKQRERKILSDIK